MKQPALKFPSPYVIHTEEEEKSKGKKRPLRWTENDGFQQSREEDSTLHAYAPEKREKQIERGIMHQTSGERDPAHHTHTASYEIAEFKEYFSFFSFAFFFS